MRPSKYNFLVPLETGDLLVYNTLYGSFSLLDSAERDAATVLLCGEHSAGSSSSEYGQRLREQLYSQRHLVPDDADELAEIVDRKMAGMEDANRLDLILLPTLNCNFACTYCYEEHRNESFTADTERRLCLWMESNLHFYKLVMLHWFGGEPLTRLDQLIRITAHAQDLAVRGNLSLLPHVTTNGYLLKEKTVGALLKANIRSFQVTIDGPSETHDRLRILRNGSPTFARVYEGVVRLATSAPDVKISLRINFNHTNLHSIPKLLQRFPENLRAQLRVVFEPVFGDSNLSAMANLSPAEIGERLASYYLLAESLGYNITFANAAIRPGRLVYCYAERANQLIVGPRGDVFKCSVGRFEEQDRVGYLAEDGKLVKDEHAWSQWVERPVSFDQACTDCVFLPLCMGGCRKLRLTGESRSRCSLAPTNASYVLKQVALGRVESAVRSMVH